MGMLASGLGTVGLERTLEWRLGGIRSGVGGTGADGQ